MLTIRLFPAPTAAAEGVICSACVHDDIQGIVECVGAVTFSLCICLCLIEGMQQCMAYSKICLQGWRSYAKRIDSSSITAAVMRTIPLTVRGIGFIIIFGSVFYWCAFTFPMHMLAYFGLTEVNTVSYLAYHYCGTCPGMLA